MRASEELAKRQREDPLAGADRGAALFLELVPLDVPELEALRLAGSLAVGEVGRTLPNAKTFHYSDGSHAIMLFSGLLDFLDAVSRILLGATNLYIGKEVLKTPRKAIDVMRDLQVLFERWKPGGISDVVDAQLAVGPLGPVAAADAAMMADAAQLFILSHELGHVLYYKAPAEEDDPTKGPVLTRAQEFAADATGMRDILRLAKTSGEARIRFAGVAISLRVLAVFAALGHQFPDTHPQPIDRLRAVIASAKSFCKTERDYWSLSPVAYAYDEMLEVAGLRAVNSLERGPLDADRMFSRLSSVLESAAKGSVAHSEVISTMAADFRDASPQVIDQVAMTAARMFPEMATQTESPNQDALWAEKAKVFRSLEHEWPEVARSAYEAAFQKMHAKEG